VVAEVDPEVVMAEALTEAAGGDETKAGEGTDARPYREPPVAIGERVEILWTMPGATTAPRSPTAWGRTDVGRSASSTKVTCLRCIT